MAGQWRYLVIFLDLFSRKVVGWDLSDSLEASGTVRALQRALQSRRLAAGLLVHSAIVECSTVVKPSKSYCVGMPWYRV